jgi:hypothetical protein
MLEVNPGAWTGNPEPTFTYAWRRDGAPIAGVTTSTYEPADDDIGATIWVTVTASNSEGAASADSNVLMIEAAQLPAGGRFPRALPKI